MMMVGYCREYYVAKIGIVIFFLPDNGHTGTVNVRAALFRG